MSTLFISHSSRDNAAAKELKARLEEQGHRSVFLDLDPEKGIQAGASWERTLYTKLRACRAVVALCSDNYLASQWCFAEIALARMEGKELFALQIEPWSEATRLPSILTEKQYLDLRTDPDAYQRLWQGFKAKGIVPEEHRDWHPEEPPYPGLRAFDERDAPIFFGRDAEVLQGVELLNRVRRQRHPRLVMVLGSSGSGKSSLARAGIVPRLRCDAESWLVVGPFRPGRQPARELAAALARAFEEAGRAESWEQIHGQLEPAGAAASELPSEPTAEEFEADPEAARQRLLAALEAMASELGAADEKMVSSVRRLKDYLEGPPAARPPRPAPPASGNALVDLAGRLRLLRGPSEATVVLVIDQFEELLGHDGKGEEHPSNRFLKLLRDGIEAEDAPLLALGTMRSDFLGVLQRSAPLEGVGFKSLSVGPMPREGMRQIIERPAKLGGIELEDGLVDLLLDDTGTSDALPLLAFTLRVMWDRYRADRLLEVREYEELGRLQGAIAQVADETLEAALELGEERDLQDAFLSLARPAAEGTGWSRKPASWDELPEKVRPMLQHFVDQRLLVQRADGTVEVAHEALFRSWQKLRGWLSANAEGLHLLGEIQIEAARWQQAEKAEEKEPYLWRAGRLARALELRQAGVLPLAALDRSFIEASDAAERARIEAEAQRQHRELRRTRIFAAIVGALFVGALGLAYLADQQRQRAEQQTRLAEQQTLRAQDQTRIAVARNWLEQDPTAAALVLLELVKPEETAYAVPLMGEALVRPLALRELIGHRDAVMSAAFGPQDSPAADRLVTASRDCTVRLWPKAGGSGEPLVLQHAKPVTDAAFSPSGEWIVTASEDYAAWLWKTDGSGEPRRLEGHEDFVNTAVFSPSGDRIVTASNDGSARIWDVDGGGEPIVLRHTHGDFVEVDSAAFDPSGDPSGQRVVTGCADGSVWLWRADGGGKPRLLEGHTHPVLSSVFSPSGDRIVTAAEDATARVWDANGQQQAVLKHETVVKSAVFGPAGDRVFTASEDGTFRMWAADGSGEPVLVGKSASQPLRIALSPAGDRLATPLLDGTVRVWSTRTGGSGEPMVLPHDQVNGAVFSPSGDRILTTSEDGAVQAWSGGSRAESVIFEDYTEALWSTAFSPSGDRMVTASLDHTARVWHAGGKPAQGSDGKALVLRHEGAVRKAAFSPLGERIVTASEDSTARVWQADGSGRPVVLPHGGAVYDAAFSPSGERIVTASADSTARIWNADGSGEPVVLQHTDPVHGAAFSPSGRRIVTASEDFNGWVWNADGSGEPIPFKGHESTVVTAAFSPSGDRIVTGSRDDTARVWSADGSGEPLVLRHQDDVVSAVFDRAGDRVLTTTLLTDARVWRVSFDPLGAKIRALTSVCLAPAFREKTLREDRHAAGDNHLRCGRCLDDFAGRASGVRLEDAFRTYRGCLRTVPSRPPPSAASE